MSLSCVVENGLEGVRGTAREQDMLRGPIRSPGQRQDVGQGSRGRVGVRVREGGIQNDTNFVAQAVGG